VPEWQGKEYIELERFGAERLGVGIERRSYSAMRIGFEI
jgi:hypothetical protein